MTAGFQALTDTGIYQIDGETLNMALRQHVTLSTADGQMPFKASNTGITFVVVCQMATFSFAASTPVVAIYAPGASVAIVSCVQTSAGQWTATLWAQAATSFEVYVFDRTDQIPATGARCGLQVFDVGGTLIADSALPLMRPVTLLSGNIAGMSPGWGQIQWPGAWTRDYSQPGIGKIATGCVVTAAAADGGGTSATGAVRPAKCYLGLSAWQHGANGMVRLCWTNTNYSGSQPGNWFCYGTSLDWAGLLIDVSNI